jgi:membrane protease YdiL (CAAX protease family)
LKDAARLLGYFVATILFGVIAAPILFWAAQWLAARGVLPALAEFEFEAFFHRAVLLGALVFLWPFLRGLRIESPHDLGLAPNPHWVRDMTMGFLISAVPVLCCGVVFVALGNYTIREKVAWTALAAAALSAVVVPFIEEALFRGLFLGVLLRASRPLVAALLSASIFSIVHFLKAPDQTTTSVGWGSGFVSLAHSLDQFAEPMLVVAGFTTLFLIGTILAYARLQTRSLWLPIGLHAGWIFANAAFNKIAQREMVNLPWLGKSLLVGIVPLGVCFISWAALRGWLGYAGRRDP